MAKYERQHLLSGTQEGIYIECVNDPTSTSYNLPVLYRLPKQVETERFVRCFNTAAADCKGFRTRLMPSDDGGVMQYISDDEPKIKVVHMSEEEFEEEKKTLIRRFDLLNDTLFRATLYITENDRFVFMDVHHIIYDGFSFFVFAEKMRMLYDGEDDLPYSADGIDVACFEEEIEKTDAYKAAGEYFEKLLDDVECDIAPLGDVEGLAPAQRQCIIDCPLSICDVDEFCKQKGISKTVFFTAVMGILANKYACRDKTSIATVYNGRNRDEYRSAVTMLVKTLPFVTDFEATPTVDSLLAFAKKQLSQSRRNSFYPFTKIVADTGASSDILFAYQGKLLDRTLISGVKMENVRLYDDYSISETKISVELAENDNGTFYVSINYRADVYSEAFIKTLGRTFSHIASEVLCKENISDITVISDEDEASISRFNQTQVPFDMDKTVVQMFSERVREHGEKTAVVYLDHSLTYKQVDDISNRVASFISSRGLTAEDVVAILVPRSEYIAVLPMAVSKAGCAYQPLDSSYPKERLSFMVEDSKAKLLITDRSLRDILSDYNGEVLYLDQIDELEAAEPLQCTAKPGDLFTLLYTSGSTGVPKGCMLEFGNITAFCNWFGKFYGIDHNSKYAAYASFGFDASMMDTYGTLTNGGQLHILCEDIRLDFTAIGDYFDKNGITHTFMTTQIGRQFAMNMSPRDLRSLSTGGEKLVPCEPPKGYDFYNLYGPTECTILTTRFKIDRYYANVPIGRPLDNFKLYVTDKWGHMLPPGACGELMITGPQVSRGYLNRPEKTAEAYTVNPFDDDPSYRRMYHSGDVVRYLSDGNIQIIGRQDGQVKIRGFRIELTEIEEVIRRFDGIKDATVAAFDDPSGGKYVAAYVVSDENVDIDALHAFIAAEKPPYMVPAVTMQIDAIPVNQNQKVNKRALPVPERKIEELIPPQTDVQQRIFDILADVLGHKDFGVTTNIYMAGITSITSVRLNILLSKEFDCAIKTSDLKSHDTIEQLEVFLTQEVKAESFEILDSYPLTKTQEGIFIECMAHPGSTVYNIPMLLKISDKLDRNRLIDAVVAAINAHPFVMTTLGMNGKGDICLSRDLQAVFSDADIEICEYSDKKSLLSELVKPFELMDSRLFRIGLYTVGEGDTYLYLDFHHIISDGTSMLILLDDISRAYDGQTVEAESFSGFEVSLSEQNARSSELFDKAKAYYDGLFGGCDADCLPQGNRKGDTPCGESIDLYTGALTADDVKRFCAENSVTENGFFTAAFGLTLGKFSGKSPAVFTTIYNGRSDSRLQRSMSMFVKTYPVLCDVGDGHGDVTCCDYIKGIGTQLEDSMANDIYSFAEISRAYQINADVMFAYQGENFTFDTLCSEPCAFEQLTLDTVKAPLNVNVYLEGERIRFFCEYRADRFDGDYIHSFLTAFEAAAQSLMKQKTLRTVSVLSEAEKEVLCALNDTEGTTYDSFISMPERLDQEIADHPDRIAVYAGGGALTYRELGELSNSVGNGLVAMNVKANEPVALMLHRTADVYPVRQGILKSGGAFVSIEPDYPDDRITYILNNAGVGVLVTTKEIYESRKALLDACSVKIAFVSELYGFDKTARPNVIIEPDQLAYCIFTSGSTGTPKGVMIEHRNLLNLLDNHDKNNITHYYLDNTSTMLALAAITFDVSVLEEFIPLYHGKSVAMATEEEIHNPILLADMMLRCGVDVMKCTPSYIQTVLDVPIVKEAFSKLKAICIGAEPFPKGLYRKMREAGITGRIYNSYGPSETTVTVTIDDMLDPTVSIGRPVGNTKVWILDDFGNILPRFAPGEITICGKSVGRGYMNMQELTAEKFITVEGLPAYKSGDIGLWNGNGKIECKGRRDNQVKLRGLRVELDEIEKVMNDFDGIDRSVVLVKGTDSDQYLCGYYTGIVQVSQDALTAFMKTKLTEYMIPGVFVYLESMPMTANGKIDKRNLPEPTLVKSKKQGRAPSTELERTFCTMFAQALGVDNVFADDDFFALGGTSLTASKIAMSCMMKQLPVAYSNIFEFTTPQALAAFVSGSGSVEHEKHSEEKEDSDAERAVLAHNAAEFAPEVTHEPLGNVLLSGSTGFLGIHVLKELIDVSSDKIYCLVRKGSLHSADERLKTLLMYYFDSPFDNEFSNGRINVIEADITEDDLCDTLRDIPLDTVINCAAIVKHFAVGDMIERVNVDGVKHLIDVAKAHDARMIQISTVSVAGESVDNSVPRDKVIHENELFFGQSLENRYVNTKFRAEEAMLEAIERGLRGKIIRVGNLMSRESDGEFQINHLTNGFMSRLRAYAALEKFPVGSSDALVEFSPIDCVAKAVVLLSGTNDSFTVFHAYNCHHIHMANVISIMNKKGLRIDVVDDREYIEHFNQQLANDKMNMKISGLISYNNADGSEHRFIGSDNSFTVKVLYRLGFAWPLTSEKYVDRAIEALETLDFFDEEN